MVGAWELSHTLSVLLTSHVCKNGNPYRTSSKTRNKKETLKKKMTRGSRLGLVCVL